MLNDRPHRLMRCWTTVPMVWCNVERPFFVIWYCSYGLMQCWTTVLVVCHIVPFVWSNVERSFSLSNAMLNDCSYGLILCWTTALVICYVVPIVWCNYKCFQKKTLTHRLYYYHRPPPLCRVNLYQTQMMQSRAKKKLTLSSCRGRGVMPQFLLMMANFLDDWNSDSDFEEADQTGEMKFCLFVEIKHWLCPFKSSFLDCFRALQPWHTCAHVAYANQTCCRPRIIWSVGSLLQWYIWSSNMNHCCSELGVLYINEQRHNW